LPARKYTAGDRANWPAAVKAFAESEEPEQFLPAGHAGDQLDYLVRHGEEVWSYSASLGGMERLTVDRGDPRTRARWSITPRSTIGAAGSNWL